MTVACQPLNPSVERDRPAPLSAIRLFLESRHYPAWAVDHAVDHIERHGTADVGPSFMLSEDREHVEKLTAIYRSTTWRDSWEAFHAVLFPDDFPQRRWEEKVAKFLWERDFEPASVRSVLTHAAIFGTLRGCREFSLNGEDRATCERMLPGVPTGNACRT